MPIEYAVAGCVSSCAMRGTVDTGWAAQRIVNMYAAWRKEWVDILRRLGLRSVRELVGRRDFLRYR